MGVIFAVRAKTGCACSISQHYFIPEHGNIKRFGSLRWFTIVFCSLRRVHFYSLVRMLNMWHYCCLHRPDSYLLLLQHLSPKREPTDLIYCSIDRINGPDIPCFRTVVSLLFSPATIASSRSSFLICPTIISSDCTVEFESM